MLTCIQKSGIDTRPTSAVIEIALALATSGANIGAATDAVTDADAATVEKC